MSENELQERRRVNLQHWFDARGGVAACLAGKSGIPDSYQSYISQLLGGYSFGSRAARTIESRLGMSPQWLDQDRNGATPTPSPPPSAPAYSQEGLSLAEALGKIKDPRARAAAYLAAMDVLAPAAASSEANGPSRKRLFVQ